MLFDHTDTEMKNKNKKKIQISFLLFWELGHLILALFTNGHFPVAVLCPRRDKKKKRKKWKLKINKNSWRIQMPTSYRYSFFLYNYLRIIYYYLNRKWKGGNWERKTTKNKKTKNVLAKVSERVELLHSCNHHLSVYIFRLYALNHLGNCRSVVNLNLLPPVIYHVKKTQNKCANFYLFLKKYFFAASRKKKGKVCDDLSNEFFCFPILIRVWRCDPLYF